MDTDFRKAAAVVLNIPPDRVMDFAFQVGYSILACQQAEVTIAHYIAVVFRFSRGMTRAEGDVILTEELKRTLGQLIEQLKKHTSVEPKTAALLKQFAGERNWLAHRIQHEDGLALSLPDRQRFAKLIARVKDVGKLAQHVQAEFGRLANNWTVAKGITPEQVNAATLAQIQKMIDDAAP